MNTKDFIVEHTNIGSDAEAMAADHEVQLGRQNLYNAAKDAIELYHMLKDVSEETGLEGWVSEKITLAADYLLSVKNFYEEQKHDTDEFEFSTFNFESAEKQLSNILEEGQLNELDSTTMQSYLDKRKNAQLPGSLHKAGNQIRGIRSAKEKLADKAATAKARALGDPRVQESQEQLDELNAERYADINWTGSPVSSTSASRKFNVVTRATGKVASSHPTRAEAERAAAKLGGFSKVKVIGVTEGKISEDTGNVNPMTQAVIGQFMRQPRGIALLGQFGPEKVMSAIDDATHDWSGEEIGTSDISAYFNQVADILVKTKKVNENASAGATGVGAIASSVANTKVNKPSTGKPKKIGNLIKRTNPTVGKGVY